MKKGRIIKRSEVEQHKHKIKHWWLSSFVRDVYSINTGGNIMNDVLLLSNGQVVSISSDIIALYKTAEDYEENTQNFETILRNKI